MQYVSAPVFGRPDAVRAKKIVNVLAGMPLSCKTLGCPKHCDGSGVRCLLLHGLLHLLLAAPRARALLLPRHAMLPSWSCPLACFLTTCRHL